MKIEVSANGVLTARNADPFIELAERAKTKRDLEDIKIRSLFNGKCLSFDCNGRITKEISIDTSINEAICYGCDVCGKGMVTYNTKIYSNQPRLYPHVLMTGFAVGSSRNNELRVVGRGNVFGTIGSSGAIAGGELFESHPAWVNGVVKKLIIAGGGMVEELTALENVYTPNIRTEFGVNFWRVIIPGISQLGKINDLEDWNSDLTKILGYRKDIVYDLFWRLYKATKSRELTVITRSLDIQLLEEWFGWPKMVNLEWNAKRDKTLNKFGLPAHRLFKDLK